jgi:hypothetical protein
MKYNPTLLSLSISGLKKSEIKQTKFLLTLINIMDSTWKSTCIHITPSIVKKITSYMQH